MKVLTLFAGLFVLSQPLKADKLYLLSNHDNVGDHNQALGIQRAFQKLAKTDVSPEDIDTSKVTAEVVAQKVNHDLKEGQKVFVVGAGEGGLLGIQDLNPQKNLFIALTSHMMLKGYENKDLINKVNFIALPAHASSGVKATLGDKLVTTLGVSHNRDPQKIDEVYATHGGEIPEAKKYLVVMLGGDAPTPKGDIKQFTAGEAAQLAQYVINAAKETNSYIVLLNGPRTGKYDVHGKEIKTAHRDGKLDSVSAEFVSRIEESGNPKRLKVFDFQFDSKSPFNSFELALGALRAKEGSILLPGDSTSMISEAIDVLPSGHVIIYRTKAMNDVHEKHVKSELTAGRAPVLTDYQSKEEAKDQPAEPTMSAAETIAQKLMQAGEEHGS